MNAERQAKLLRCWGKTGKQGEPAEVFHPAIFHMLDAGNVARVLLAEEASPRWRHVLADGFDADPGTVQDWLPWAVAIHDLGKISAAFQRQNQAQAQRMKQEGFRLPGNLDLRHPLVGQIALRMEGQLPSALNGKLGIVLAEMVGGHHGLFLAPSEAREEARRLRRDEPPEWRDLRGAALELLSEVFLPPAFDGWPEPKNLSTAILTLTGITILCDWIGSNSLHFTPAPETPLDLYLSDSAKRALEGVRASGLMQPCRSNAPTEFARLFQGFPPPRPLQKAIDSIADNLLARPCLVIVEAPTGEGKTETAFALAHRMGNLRGSDEFYYALPTAATSNQMYTRIRAYLREQLGLPTQVKLVHSQAFLIEDQLEVDPLTDSETDETLGVTLEWFSSKKRALLAPFGVGTIDQTELGALNVAHNCLRLVGLAGKTVILDEVHAYDTYMTTIIERLLQWLAALGTSVILLSATLPASRREALRQAYGAARLRDRTQAEAYPCLWVGNQATAVCQAVPAAQPERSLAVNFLHVQDDDPTEKARWLLAQLGEKGCLCWITNTVQRAQEIYAALDALAPPGVERLLIHSRFPLAPMDPQAPLSGREHKEAWLTDRFGPKGTRPKKAIVIGTQILEQSLDLDFDLMVSDLAPIDLLLQRAGRLHRHIWRQLEARGAHSEPTLWVYLHQNEDGSLDLRSDRAIYAEYFLRRTAQALAVWGPLTLPQDYRPLIDAVYAVYTPGEDGLLDAAWEKLQRAEALDCQAAQERLLPWPNPDDPFSASAARLAFEEDEDRAGWIVARTRNGEESVTLIPLERQGKTVRCPGMEAPIPLDQPAGRALELALLRAAIKLSGQDLAAALRAAAQPLPVLFTQSALLKHAYPLWCEEGRACVEGRDTIYQLELDPRLGLKLHRQKGSAHD